jgi:endonuclease V-like protein UPF0215 family
MKYGVQAIGIVYRGKQALDGVLTRYIPGRELTKEIALMIKKSPHFNQVRVVLLDETKIPRDNQLDEYELFENTGKPVLAMCKDREMDERFMFNWRSWTVTSAGLSENDATQVLNNSTISEDYPEVLRVANLVSSGLQNL